MATALFVAYNTPSLDLGWIPPDAPVVVVHNDSTLPPPGRAENLFMASNVGFGAAVNRALDSVATRRLVLCNPDVDFSAQHWDALALGDPSEVVTIPLRDSRGDPTAVVSPYPTPLSLLLTGYRAGRLLRRGSAARRTLASLLGPMAREHDALQRADTGAWPLTTHWCSGAAFSVEAERLRAVGGFDESYFLYLEDADVCRRLAERFPDMLVRLAAAPPAVHQVGASSAAPQDRRDAERRRLESVLRYARRSPGVAGAVTRALLRPRLALLGRR